MILTLTSNPSLDKTITLKTTLKPGEIIQSTQTTQEPGGKGINVSKALHAAKINTIALFPSPPNDPLIQALKNSGIPIQTIPTKTKIRTNITLCEPDGTTTKINEPGTQLSTQQLNTLHKQILTTLKNEPKPTLVIAGSLPPNTPQNFLTQIITSLKSTLNPFIALDTSGTPLATTIEAAAQGKGAPDLIKPNAEELAQLLNTIQKTTKYDGKTLETNPQKAAKTAETLLTFGIKNILLTLGPKGAILINKQGTWLAQHPPITAQNTVGAGDCALAGFLIAQSQNKTAQQCLAQAVAYGTSATQLPGSQAPKPTDTTPELVKITSLR